MSDFCLVTWLKDTYKSDSHDGVLGLAPNSLKELKGYNFLQKLKYQEVITYPIFSIYLGKDENQTDSHI